MKKKLKRTLTSFLPVEDGRTGSCNNCGACCRLPFRCVFLKTVKGELGEEKEYCSIYAVRPPNCRKFPRSPEEHQLVKDTCGFNFDTSPKKNDKDGAATNSKFIRISSKN